MIFTAPSVGGKLMFELNFAHCPTVSVFAVFPIFGQIGMFLTEYKL